MTLITSSSISLEGKTINITKSLPISEKDILKSKIIYPYIIELPFVIISELIFFIVFKVNIIYILLIFSMSISTITLSSILGLVINLKYPKMNASNDTEVVKQSMSSMVAVFINMGIIIISVIGIFSLYDKLNIYLLFLLILTTLIDWSLQFFNILSSNNIRRLVTGILGGIGLMGIYVYIVIKLFDLFKNILQS